jgi:hypothetical protein
MCIADEIVKGDGRNGEMLTIDKFVFSTKINFERKAFQCFFLLNKNILTPSLEIEE